MKIAAGLLAAAIFAAGAAAAQDSGDVVDVGEAEIAAAPASRCGPFPAPPVLPLSGRRSRQQVLDGVAAMARWNEALEAAYACRRTEFDDLTAQARAIQAQRAARVRENAAWRAQVEEIDQRWAASVERYNRTGR